MSETRNQDLDLDVFRRTELHSEVEIHVDAPSARVLEGHVVDVGVGGIRARLGEGVPEGTLCTVHFTDPEVGKHAARGFVRRASSGADGFLVGIEFEKPLASLRAPSNGDHLEGFDLVATKILVVDDEEGVVELLYRFLSGLGCEVCTAHSGEEALEAIRSDSPDLTLLDMRMPGMGGLEVLEKISEENLDAGKVWMVSGAASDDEARDALERGAADFINKPLDLKYLEWSMRLHRATA